jgi:hypothetical protein
MLSACFAFGESDHGVDFGDSTLPCVEHFVLAYVISIARSECAEDDR